LLPSIHLKWRREKEKEASWGLLAMMVLMFAVCTDERKRACEGEKRRERKRIS
jgi:hypothetical protein